MSKQMIKVSKGDLLNQVLSGAEYTGFENIDNECLSIPFLRIAQKASLQADKDSASYIKGLKPGDFFSSIGAKNLGNTLKVIALGFYRAFTIWGEELGEFKGILTTTEFKKLEPKLAREGGKWLDSDNNRYMDTRNFFVMLPDFIDEGILLFPMSSTGITHSKKWLSMQEKITAPNGKRAPIFATIWTLETVLYKKDKFNWYQIGNIKNEGFIDNKIVKEVLGAIEAVKEYLKVIKNINYEKIENEEDDKIPF